MSSLSIAQRLINDSESRGGPIWLPRLPKGWYLKRLKYLAAIYMSQSPPSTEYTLDTDDLPFLQGNADFGPRFPVARIFCPTAPRRATPGSILFSVRAPVGAINISDQEYGMGRGLIGDN